MKKLVNLFQSRMLESKLHPAFRALRDSSMHVDARSLMNELYARMGDPNGNFPRDFQTDGFHSRLFELACFAYLESAGFVLDRSHESPDFLATTQDGVTIAIEATTANPTAGRATDISLVQMPDLSEAEIFNKVESEFPRRMVSVLQKKLAHRYHELPHCFGKPLVLMVAPFFEPGAVFYTGESLLKCLYGAGEIAADSAVPFFDLPDAGSISAVLYCNAFTVPRFLRLATKFDNAEEVRAVRQGVCYIGDPGVDSHPHEFQFQVGDSSAPEETWHEGVSLFINPNAAHPLLPSLLPRTCTFSARENVVNREVHGFHPVTSFMRISVGGNGGKAA
ncbi:MAG: hypothetical protein WBP25_16740 [Giesbergeria sp.]